MTHYYLYFIRLFCSGYIYIVYMWVCVSGLVEMYNQYLPSSYSFAETCSLHEQVHFELLFNYERGDFEMISRCLCDHVQNFVILRSLCCWNEHLQSMTSYDPDGSTTLEF